MTNAKALCLNMIVKNEMANLERCLTAVADHIDCWVIGDTGSTDGTQDFIRSFFAARNIPGELHSFPFVNFAQARNEALDRARASKMRFDYILLTDADMELTVKNPAFAQNLTSAAYKVLQYSRVTYWNIRLLRRDVAASYKGVTHEFVNVREGKTRNLEDISFIDHASGSNRADKYERDIRLLTDAITTERDPGMIARYTFYLANTFRDSGQKEAALETYLKRASLGDWQQEVFMSLLNAAELKEALQHPNDDVVAAYESAAAACPTRAEALHGAAHFCRDKGIYERGYEFAAKALGIEYPKDGLFVRDWVYEYGLLDELAINAYWTGRYQECIDSCDRLLNEGRLPAEKRDRVLKNKNFAVSKQQEIAALASAEDDVFLKLLRDARRKEELARPDDEVIAAYMEATAACPARAEALHGAARFCRNRAMYERGYEFAKQGVAIAYPKGAHAVEDWIYEYGLVDELAINAYWTGRYGECVDACDRLLSEGKLPTEKRDRVLKNKNFAISKQQEIAASAPPESEAFMKLLDAAWRKEELADPDDEVIAAYVEVAPSGAARAKALHEAARFCRNKGMHNASVLFCEAAFALALEQDTLTGLQEEFSIAANYARDPALKSRGFAACDSLALNRTIPSKVRDVARSNLFFYLQPANKMMPSFVAHPIEFQAPGGYRSMNPSIARRGEQLVLVQRTVNYTIDHSRPDGDNARYIVPENVFRTRNFLLNLSDDLGIQSSVEILSPRDMPTPVFARNLGFQDLRPFVWRDGLWCCGYVAELTPEGWYEQVLARIDVQALQGGRLTDWRVLRPEGPKGNEKNWMPRVDGDTLQFIYSCDPVRMLDEQARLVVETNPPIAAEAFRGGSQAIAFDGGWLALIHEVRVRDGQRQYRHRFICIDEAARLRGVSRQFFFHQHGVEFAAGLAWHPDGKRLLISYGVEDSEAWIATVDADDVRRVVEDADRLPSGEPRADRSYGLLKAANNATAMLSPKKGRETDRMQPVTLSPKNKEPPNEPRGSASQLHFVVGVPRSGTTLFRAMLGAHPRICAPSETPWLCGGYGDGPSLRELLRNLASGDQGPVKNIRDVFLSDVTRAAEEFLFALFATKMRTDGKDILVLKTPDDILFVDDLLRFFPKAKILHIRRDVRDVALSTVVREWRRLNHFGENSFANAVTRWIACETKIADLAKTNPNISSFRFEDLVTRPEMELGRAAKLLGVSFDKAMVDYARHLRDAPGWEAGSRDVKRQASVDSARAWAHREIRPTDEQRRIIEINADKIEGLGYSADWGAEARSAALSLGVRIAAGEGQNGQVSTEGAGWLGLDVSRPGERQRQACTPHNAPSILRIFHFITGLDGNFGGKPFSFIHYMAIRSALRVNHGFRAKVYYHHEPRGKYWDAIKGDVELVRVDLPTEVFGNPVEHFAHKADILRLRILLEQGGIYLDLDTICQRPFEPLLDGRVVMGREERVLEDGSRTTVGLCNAAIIAPPNAEFLRLWYEAYRDFSGGLVGDGWNKFSVQVPMTLAKERPELLRVEPAASFFWPNYEPAGIAAMFSTDREFPEAFSFHLWESRSWGLAKDLDLNAVRTVDTTYNKIARRYLDAKDESRLTSIKSGDSGQGVNADAVCAVYRVILGREPENEAVIRWHVQHAANLETLLRNFVSSDEFRFKNTRGGSALQGELLDFLSQFTPSSAVGHAKIRVGNPSGDGAYVMLDDFEGIVGALSAGIGGDVSWDQEIANRGIDIYQFDHTIAGPPAAHERFHFFRRKISSKATDSSESIRSVIDKIPHSEGRLIFKIDIEGAEWEAFDAVAAGDLRRVAQLVGEFHGFSNAANNDWRERAKRVITKLNDVFQIVHVHGNNWSSLELIANVPFPDVVEVTFVNRAMYQFEEAVETYPTSIDRPNHGNRPDIFLGSLRFKRNSGDNSR